MKAIVVMFDSLNRHFLSPYGCEWTHTPNFKRLAERTVTFDKSYVCSMPCMPARRDFHTGRPNFLHRSWGPLEPFDDSVPRMLRENGVSSHLLSDHQHYWEDGGCTYHTQYSTWQFFRGQEGDLWKGQVIDPSTENTYGRNSGEDPISRQDLINRQFMKKEEDQPQAKTFNAGIDFIECNHTEDNWFLQIETFDPHEPFFSQRKYKDHFAEHYQNYDGPLHDWPSYAPVKETREQIEHMRFEYASLLAMCDAKLGNVLDLMDEFEMWEDTMLVVWTDHGFLLAEHDCWAKMWMPLYEEIAHTPFFVWDPRSGKKSERRQSLVQPSIDLGPTLLDFFGLDVTDDMVGKPLGDTVANDTLVREAAIFGMFGHQANVTDGRYMYNRVAESPENQPLYEYTLMPTHIRSHFQPEELAGNIELSEPLSFTKNCEVMKISSGYGRGFSSAITGIHERDTELFDLDNDPKQENPIHDPETEKRMIELMTKCMQECDAPSGQYERLGLTL